MTASRIHFLVGALLTALALALGLYYGHLVDRHLSNTAQLLAGQGVLAPVDGRSSAGWAGLLNGGGKGVAFHE